MGDGKDYYATIRRLPLFEANMFAPAHLSLAFGEHLFGVALFAFPLFASGIAPLAIHNVMLLIGFAGCGYAMYRLARAVTGSTATAVIGGIAYAFAGIRFHHLEHVHLVWTMWLPLLLLGCIRLVEEPTARRSFALSLVVILNGLTSLHWFAFGTLTALVTVAAFGLVRRGIRDVRFWMLAALSFAVAGVLLAPFLLPYATVSRLYGMHREYSEILANGARWHDWLVPNLQSKLYGRWSPMDSYSHERTLFPGFVVLILAAWAIFADVRRIRLDWGVVRRTRRKHCDRGHRHSRRLQAPDRAIGVVAPADRSMVARAVVARLGVWGARGLYGALHTFLYRYAFVFRGMRMPVPVRWAFVGYVGLDLLAAIGMKRLIESRPRREALALSFVVAAALLFELRTAPVRFFVMPTENRPVYAWLTQTRVRGGVMELPMTQEGAYTYL